MNMQYENTITLKNITSTNIKKHEDEKRDYIKDQGENSDSHR